MDDDQDRELLAVECEHWRTRARAAERRAAVLAALLGCAGEIVEAVCDYKPIADKPDADGNRIGVHRVLRLLATDPHELMRLVPETRPIIAHALGAAGLTIEDLDVLEETT